VTPKEQTAKKPPSTTGLFALLSSLLRVKGTGAGGRALNPSQGTVSTIRTLTLAAVASLCALVGALAFLSAPAQAELVRPLVGSFGSFTNVQGLTVDQATGDVYVFDAGTESILKFDAAGNPVNFTETGTNAIKESGGAGGGENQIAVSSSGPSAGDIYVAHGRSVQIFNAAGANVGELNEADEAEGHPWGESCGVAVDGAGNVYVGLYSEKVNKYTPTGEPVTNANYVATMSGLRSVCNLAVDSEGNVYAATYNGGVSKYDPMQFGSLAATGTEVDETGNTLAIDPETSDVYIDEGSQNGQVAQYNPAGSLIGHIGAGELKGSIGVAVKSGGDLYVGNGSGRVDIFGANFVVEPDVTPLAATSLKKTTAKLNGSVNPDGTAVSACEFEYGPEVGDYEYTTACTQALPLTGESPVAVSAETSGLTSATTYHYRLAATNENGTNHSADRTFTTSSAVDGLSTGPAEDITPSSAKLTGSLAPDGEDAHYYFEYATDSFFEDPSTSPLPPGTDAGSASETVAAQTTLSGLAANTTYDYRIVGVNAAGTSRGEDATFTTTGPARVIAEAPESVGHTGVTVKAQVYPDGFDTIYHIEYGEAASYGASTPAVDLGAGEAPGEPQEPVSISAELSSLRVGTTYHYRVVAVSSQGTVDEPDQEVETTPAVSIDSEFATGVTATSATLHAQLNPLGEDTHYHFEYGTSDCAGSPSTCKPAQPETDIGSTAVDQAGSVYLQELTPGTTYHYRVIASNGTGTTEGRDRTFTTQSVGAQSTLPDGRAYELVSPEQKDGAEILGIGGGGETPGGGDATQVSEDGTSVTYLASAPVGASPPGNTLATQILSTRGPGGWSSQDIATPHKTNIEVNHILNEGEEYLRFSSDLSRAVLVPLHEALEPPLAPEVHQEVGGETEIYLRDNITGVFQALVTAEPLQAVRFEGATPDLGHIVFGGPAGLDPSYPGAGGLYEWSKGRARLVDVLPNGEPASGATRLGGSVVNVFGEVNLSATRYAVSSEGTQIVWNGEGGLFTRDMTTGETVEVDAAQGGGGSSGGGVFLAANTEGSRVFFTDPNELTSGASEGGLFMFDVADGHLTDLTPEGNGGQVQSFIGANEEGTSIYEVSPAVLTSGANGQGETATAGASNVYLLREASTGSGAWSTTFIAAGEEEGTPGNESLQGDAPLARQTARVSPNGGYLAFMSEKNLTGYDNRDANSGEQDEEVYLYDAEANSLACPSCNPTGARPVGEYDTGEFPGTPMDPLTIWAGRSLAATIPSWTPDGASLSTGYQPRYLSDSGRLFFDSADALVPQDVDGNDDVYEYEPPMVGSCQPPTYGQSASDVFSHTAGGCVGLISAGTSDGASTFFDASASGNDVFFTTVDGLVTQDQDGTSDMYDARVCTPAEPCPQSLVSAPPCTTADSCRAAPAPQPGVFAAPPSATFAGAGNLAPTPGVKVKVKAKTKQTTAQVRAEKLAKALKACKKKPKKKRAVCRAQARKKYGKAKTSGRRVK